MPKRIDYLKGYLKKNKSQKHYLRYEDKVLVVQDMILLGQERKSRKQFFNEGQSLIWPPWDCGQWNMRKNNGFSVDNFNSTFLDIVLQ